MRIAILADIHGNLDALTRVLEQVYALSAERIVCLGDTIGYGAHPNECLSLVRANCTTVVRGNHEAGVAGLLPAEHFEQYGRAALAWTRNRLTDEHLAYVRELPLSVSENEITLVHASPKDPGEWNYMLTWPQVQEQFGYFMTTVCCIGHTHVPAIIGADGSVNNFRPGQRHIINPGSVGQPRDGNPRASFALLDTGRSSATIVRVPYDIAATARAIREAGLPPFLADRLASAI